MKKRLLMVTGDTAAASGTEGAFLSTLTGFHSFWDRIDVLCPHIPRGKIRLTPFSGVFFYSIPPIKIFAPFYVFIRGLSICRAHKPNLIVAHAYGPQFMACGAWLLSKVMDIPLVLEVHHVDGYPRAANVKEHIFRVISILFFRIAGRSAIAFRAVNNEVALALSRCGIPQSKIKLIYSMYIDHAVFYPMPNIQKKYDLIFVGRLASNKGLGRLLAVFKTILRKLPSTSFFILGDGPQAAWLSRAIMGNTSIIHMKRVGSAYDVALLYNRSRVAVCASFAEGGPRYIVEALACGVPAVSVSVGLMRELIIDGKNGFLISPWSADAMAEKIISILEGDVGVYGAYRDNAVRSVARFDYADSIAAYAHAYHALITV